ncbi:hypothetical protein DJ533_03615 [Acinetobacter defluvii]|uniref:Uncharacterized protein n=1 Tax=Acinetobacter defluvii TaxID=1871111 RepID=A0A2S2FAC8_9GAMM|nr:hypothetical protein [Acinetobacter defluvii]AWL27745.1 hypothetical protein DJ533_03615 [Acinetobacter defluvii]
MDEKYQLHLHTEIQKRRSLWKNIANRSGELEIDDVINEAWLFACHQWKNGAIFNSQDENDWKYLYGVIDKKLVKYTEKNIKYAVQIDQPYHRNSFEEKEHPVLKTLFADETLEPLKKLEQLEQNQEYEQNFNQQIRQLGYSKIAAFLKLSHSFYTSRMQTAYSMNMSYSWFYESGRVFQRIYTIQRSLFDDQNIEIESDQLRTWRKFKEKHTKNIVNKKQLNFQF